MVVGDETSRLLLDCSMTCFASLKPHLPNCGEKFPLLLAWRMHIVPKQYRKQANLAEWRVPHKEKESLCKQRGIDLSVNLQLEVLDS